MDKLFMSNGFRVEMVNYKGVTESSEEELASAHYNNILFVAEQLRLSDDQVRHFLFTTICPSCAFLLIFRLIYLPAILPRKGIINSSYGDLALLYDISFHLVC